jgi:hypothetical protein
VVAEIEYRRLERCSRSTSTSVSLPAPDGPDTTNSRPGPVINPPLFTLRAWLT